MESIILTLNRLIELPQLLWGQYPVTIAAMVFLFVGITLGRSRQGKRSQDAVDQTVNELVDREKTARVLFLCQLRAIGILDQRDRLVLEGKYGPGIASDISMAKIVVRLMLEHFCSSESLARDIVDHFMTNERVKFNKRRGFLEAFWQMVISEFSDRIDEQITDRGLLDEAIARRLAHYLRLEDSRLAYLKNEKEKRRLDRRERAFNIVYGIEKTIWQTWINVAHVRFLSLIKRHQAKAPAPADTLP